MWITTKRNINKKLDKHWFRLRKCLTGHGWLNWNDLIAHYWQHGCVFASVWFETVRLLLMQPIRTCGLYGIELNFIAWVTHPAVQPLATATLTKTEWIKQWMKQLYIKIYWKYLNKIQKKTEIISISFGFKKQLKKF